jgi:catechol 2,3-dioxygenase-like lactoylglutathione lyase family enzyme
MRVSDLAAAEAFYRTVLPVVGLDREWPQLALELAGRTITRRLHVAFFAESRAEVDEFWRVGTAAGYRDDGSPGPRPRYADDYYGGFVLDPDGNSVEAVHLGNGRGRGEIDHLWIRVADLEASRDFYERLGERSGFVRVRAGDHPPRVGFEGPNATFSIVRDGPATEHARLTFLTSGASGSMSDPDGNTIELLGSDR